MQSKRKSSWKILVVAAAANLLAGAALAAPDAPHDAGNSIGCLTCHQMTSTYPKLLPPLGGTPVDMDDTYANRVCRSCHDGTGSTIVLTDTHSSLTMSNKYGDWTVECWVCHNEHLQEQNRYNGSTYGMYIRRNINLANIKKPDGTSLKTGTKAVVFTGPATFADGNAIYNGICEVCHTQTTHFRNDGSGSDQNHSGKQGSDCVSCHNHDTGFTGGAVHNTFIADDNKTGDVNTKCSGCHTNYATAPETAHSACAACHTTAPTLVDSTFPTANGQVDDDGTSMFANLATAGYTFNGTTGRLNDPDGTDIAGVGGNGVFAPVKCGVCHAAKPDALAAVPAEHGGHPVTDWDYSSITNDCLDCHADGGNGTIQGVHSNTCTLCHVNPAGGDFARKIGDAANGIDGNALLATGRTGDCLTCHPGATYTKTKIHHDTANAVATPTNGCTTACHNTTTGHAGNHNTLVAIQNPPCQGCHNGAAASGGNNVPVDGTAGNLVHDYCTSCHVNPSNDLIATVTAPTAHATTMNNADGTTATNNGGGTCTACHTAYFEGHEHKTAHTMPTVDLCLNCHTGATTPPYSDNGEVHQVLGCYTCHNTATGLLQGSAGAAVGGENCQGCHTAYFNGHSHSHPMTTVPLCTSCHTATAAPYITGSQVHAGSGCATCHDLDATPTGAPIGSASGKTDAENCQGCHTTYFDGHGHGGTTATPNHTQTLAKDALCGNCHGTSLSGPDAITAPYTAGSEVHYLDGCMTCHSPVNGAPLVGSSAANWGATWSARASGTCVTCHTAGFAVHPHTHTFTATADCATCHGNNVAGSNARDAITAPFVGAGEVHAASGCATCHNAATGALIGSATGHAAATGCIDCHTATWTTIHTAALGTGAGTVDHATRVEGAAACTTCHGNPTPVTSNARDAQATPYIVAGDVHAAGCALCHTGNNNGGLRSSGLTKADTVAAGTCTTCHAVTSTWTTIHDTATGAVTGVSHATRVDGLAACTTCHTATAGGAAGVMPYSASDDKVHDACATCHQATGSLNSGNTTYGGQPIAKGTCGTCHTATYFDSHTHHNTAKNQLTYSSTVDRSQGADLAANACAECHRDKTGDNTSFNTFDGIRMEHDIWDATKDATGGCTTCHNYAANGEKTGNANTPLLATVVTRIGTDATTSCTQCHVPKLWSEPTSTHGGHAANHFTWAGGCESCHGAGLAAEAVVADIHSNNCDLCHTTGGPYNAGTNKVGASGDGDATLAEGNAGTWNASCTTCHNPTDPDVNGTLAGSYGAIHHDSSDAANNNCTTTCHTSVAHNTTITNTAAGSTAASNTIYGCNATYCHTGASSVAGTATGAPTSLTDPKVHDSCRTCHTFNTAPNLDGIRVTLAAASKGVPAGQIPAGGDCATCHTTKAGTYHHQNANTPIGNCEWCHEDPRTTPPQDGYTKPAGFTVPPKHLACQECHVQPKAAAGTGQVASSQNTRTNGWQSPTANTMTVTAFNKGSNTAKTSGNWSTNYTKSTVHPVPNTAGKIDNWGICLGCHDGTTNRVTAGAVQVQPHHALPTNISPTQAYCGTGATYGRGQYLPGRTNFNDISNVNYFGDFFRPTGTRPRTTTNYAGVAWGSTQCGNRATGSLASQAAGYTTNNSRANGRTYKGATMPLTAGSPSADGQMTIPNPWTGVTHNTNASYNYAAMIDQIMVFADEAQSSDVTAPAADDVTVTGASWDGSNLTVTATNTVTTATLNVWYDSDGPGAGGVVNLGAMTESPEGVWTFTSGTVSYSGTVDVRTSSGSVNVSGYPVTDASGPTAASATADAFSAADTGNTVLSVLTNDTGTNLEVVTGTVSAVSKTSGTGTCGSVSATTADITYTGGGGNAVCTFTYEAQAYWTGTPYGAASQATVTVTQTANAPPAFGATSYNAANATEGVAYTSTVAQDATDPESDPITYSRNGGTCGAWASVAANGTISGTPAVGDAGACTVIVRATATGGFDEATVNITVVAAPACLSGVTLLNNWELVATGSNTGTYPASGTISASATNSRTLVVVYGAEAAATMDLSGSTGTYGASNMTLVVQSGAAAGTTFRNSAIFICDNTCIANAGASKTITIVPSTTPSAGQMAIAAVVYEGVNQTTPYINTLGVGYDVGGANAANLNPDDNGGITLTNGDRFIYGAYANTSNLAIAAAAGFTQPIDTNATISSGTFAAGYRNVTTAATVSGDGSSFTYPADRVGTVAIGLNSCQP